MRSEAEVLESINSLRSQLGMEPQSEPVAPTAQSTEDVQARIDALNEKLATTPMSRREFIEKRIADDQTSLVRKPISLELAWERVFQCCLTKVKMPFRSFIKA